MNFSTFTADDAFLLSIILWLMNECQICGEFLFLFMCSIIVIIIIIILLLFYVLFMCILQS